MLEIEAAQSGKVLVIGHRGAMGYAPENTMVSFQTGWDQKADLLECDIHLSKDGQVVVIHDANVRRTTDGQGYVSDMSVAELKRLDAGAHFAPDFKGQRIPLLSELLSWAKDRIELVIEIKGEPLPPEGIEEKLIDELDQYDMIDKVIVISFHHPAVERVKEINRSVATGILYTGRLSDTVGAARAARADSVRPSWPYWTPAIVDEVHRAGKTASAWTGNEERIMQHLVDMGLDSIGTNYPDRLRSLLDRLGKSWNQ